MASIHNPTAPNGHPQWCSPEHCETVNETVCHRSAGATIDTLEATWRVALVSGDEIGHPETYGQPPELDVLVVSKVHSPPLRDRRGDAAMVLVTTLKDTELLRLVAALQACAAQVPLPEWPAAVNYGTVTVPEDSAA